jgi:hypothetical protein
MVEWTNSFSFDRSLVDLSTGTVHLQKEGLVCASITENPLAGLHGKAFVALSSAKVLVVDEKWLPTLGALMRIPGGCELAVDEEALSAAESRIDEGLEEFSEARMIQCVVVDPVYPSVKVAVPYRVRRINFNVSDAGTGPRRARYIKRCGHAEQNPPPLCEYCFRRWWKKKEAEWPK